MNDRNNNLSEYDYITKDEANYDWLMESKEQLEKGIIITKELSEIVIEEDSIS